MTNSETERLLVELPPPEDDENIPSRFRAVAGALPEHPAVLDALGATDYATLDWRSDRVAAQLLSCCGDKPEPVCLLLPNTAEFVTGMLGVLKAGKFYTPLDAINPSAFQRDMVAASKSAVLITTVDLLPMAEQIMSQGMKIVLLAPDEAQGTSTFPVLHPEMYASVAFTSGSTGKPKGVIWHHGGWLHRSKQCYIYDNFRQTDRVAQLLSPAFGLYSTVVWATLLNGATLVYPPQQGAEIRQLLQWLYDEAITVWFTSVGLLREVLASPRTVAKLPAMRTILPGGEKLLARDLLGLPDLVSPECTVTNRLSMSELQLVTRHVITTLDIEASTKSVPIGHACEGNEIQILGFDGNPVEPGEVGEIVVRSRYLSPGYWNEPELTAHRFRPDPDGGDRRVLYTGDLGRTLADGSLEYLGRKDLMVKVRGHRVEPESVEIALMAHPNVSECAVAVRPSRSGESQLIAYLVYCEPPAPSVPELRNLLAGSLPSYMIPARFVFLDKLPRNTSDKVNRSALPPPGKARPDLDTPFVAPRSELEQQIADIWAELLDLDQVGVDDNFFELGGDSILAMRMVLEVEQRLARQIPPEFFRWPTIGNLSSIVQLDPAAGTVKTAERSPYSQQQSAPAPPPPAPRRRFWRRRTRIGILHRLRRPAEDAIFNRAHDQVWRRLAQWCAAATRVGIYTPELDLLNRMQQALDNQMSISPTQRQAYLMGNLLMQQWWRLPRASTTSSGMEVLQASTQPFWANLGYLLQHGADEELDGQFSATGWEILKQAYQPRQGVILVSYHSPGLPFAIRAASRRIGGEPILTVVQYGGLQANKRGTQRASAIADDVTAVTSERTVRAFQQLRRGGIIHFANDHGYTTDGTMGCPVAGRQYAFKPTFAEMAQATGAAIVPTLAFCTPSGQIHAVFLSPFSLPTTNSDSVRFAREALNQYASFLAQSWRAYPESLLWSVIATHLQRPVSTPSE